MRSLGPGGLGDFQLWGKKEEGGEESTCDEGGTVIFFELCELTAVDDSGDDFVGWDLFSEVRADDAGEFFWVI